MLNALLALFMLAFCCVLEQKHLFGLCNLGATVDRARLRVPCRVLQDLVLLFARERGNVDSALLQVLDQSRIALAVKVKSNRKLLILDNEVAQKNHQVKDAFGRVGVKTVLFIVPLPFLQDARESLGKVFEGFLVGCALHVYRLHKKLHGCVHERSAEASHPWKRIDLPDHLLKRAKHDLVDCIACVRLDLVAFCVLDLAALFDGLEVQLLGGLGVD